MVKLPKKTSILLILLLSLKVHGQDPCTDKAICASATTALCIHQAIVDDCPLLCHEKSTTCNVCNDKDICTGLDADLCQYPEVVADCSLLCADKSSCVPKECIDGFVNVNNQCLMFSKDRLTWSAATTTCENLKGRLVVPTDFTKMADHIIKNDMFDWQYWVGVSDQSDPGTYKWLDGTSVDSGLWYTGSPGTSGVTKGQSCVKLYHRSNTNNGLIAAWDTNCDGIYTNRYICEKLP